jgi:acyl carrier protein
LENLEKLEMGILEIFVECFDTRLASAEVDLLEARLVDSVKLVDLVLQIEQRFGVTLNFEELEIEDFRNVARIAERIARNTPAGP